MLPPYKRRGNAGHHEYGTERQQARPLAENRKEKQVPDKHGDDGQQVDDGKRVYVFIRAAQKRGKFRHPCCSAMSATTPAKPAISNDGDIRAASAPSRLTIGNIRLPSSLWAHSRSIPTSIPQPTAARTRIPTSNGGNEMNVGDIFW